MVSEEDAENGIGVSDIKDEVLGKIEAKRAPNCT